MTLRFTSADSDALVNGIMHDAQAAANGPVRLGGSGPGARATAAAAAAAAAVRGTPAATRPSGGDESRVTQAGTVSSGPGAPAWLSVRLRARRRQHEPHASAPEVLTGARPAAAPARSLSDEPRPGPLNRKVSPMIFDLS